MFLMSMVFHCSCNKEFLIEEVGLSIECLPAGDWFCETCSNGYRESAAFRAPPTRRRKRSYFLKLYLVIFFVF